MSDDQLVDRIYEAAFVPEHWPDVLGRVAEQASSASGSLLVFDALDQPPRFKSTPLTEQALNIFTSTDLWRDSQRIPFQYPGAMSGQFPHFFYVDEIATPGQFRDDTVAMALRQIGLESQITTVMPMPTLEVVSFTFERLLGRGRHGETDIARLNQLRPHLARSGLISARLRLERATSAVSALQALGMPAAAISGNGRVLTANDIFERMNGLFQPAAFGRLALADAEADRLLREAILQGGVGGRPIVRTIPVRARPERNACVIHVLPLRRSAFDVFSGADSLVVAMEIRPENGVPSAQLLSVLFDLTASEAAIVAGLAGGKPLQTVALDLGVQISSARTYLSRVFEKTGTGQQSQLVALVKGIGATSD